MTSTAPLRPFNLIFASLVAAICALVVPLAAKTCYPDAYLPPAIPYVRSTTLTDQMLAAAGAIQPLDVDGNPDENGLICPLLIGMSNLDDVTVQMRLLLDTPVALGGVQEWIKPNVLPILAGQAAKTITFWDDVADKMWRVTRRKVGEQGCTPAQVQMVYAWLADVETGDPVTGASITEAGVRAVFDAAIDPVNFQNIKIGYVSGLNTTLYCVDPNQTVVFKDAHCKIWEPRVYNDDRILGEMVEAGGWTYPVSHLTMWSQGSTPNAVTEVPGYAAALTNNCTTDVTNDGVHQQPGSLTNNVGSMKQARSILARWKVDPAMAWMFVP